MPDYPTGDKNVVLPAFACDLLIPKGKSEAFFEQCACGNDAGHSACAGYYGTRKAFVVAAVAWSLGLYDSNQRWNKYNSKGWQWTDSSVGLVKRSKCKVPVCER